RRAQAFFAFSRSELFEFLLAHRAVHFLLSALQTTGTCLSTLGSERSARSFLLGSRFGWHVELPGLVAGRGVLLRWLLDFLRFVFGWRGLVSAASLNALIFTHLCRVGSRTILVSLHVTLSRGLLSSDDDGGFPEGCWMRL